METIWNEICLCLGLKLVGWALACLPRGSWRREELARELADHRQYERYEAYTLMLHGLVLPFQQWRAEWRGMKRPVRLLEMPRRRGSARKQARA